MKIGFFTSIEGWGGSETYLLSLMIGIRDAGHVPVLFGVKGTRLWREAHDACIEGISWRNCSPLADLSTGEPPCFADSDNRKTDRLCKIIRRLVPDWAKLLAGNVGEVMYLRRLFRQFPVDVMHINLNGYEVAGLACRLNGIPSVGWHCIMPCRDPTPLRRWLNRWTCWSYTIMGGMSQACIDAWRGLSGLPSRRCRMVWNGIDLLKYQTDNRSVRCITEPFCVLAVGRLHPMKGFDVLIQAFGLLNDQRVRLIIAGDGSDEKMLKSLAFEQECSSSISFVGHREDMETLYKQAHCLVLPSVSHESFGFVLAEAMAFGLPLITSDFGPLPEINIDGETGLVVPSGDSRALALAIQHLVDHPEDCARFGINGIKRANECFSRERMISAMVDIYQDLA